MGHCSVCGGRHLATVGTKDIQDRGKAMMRDAEEMVMHGGMGDGKAIIHHCGEVAKQAETILTMLPPADEHGKEAVPHLQEAIRHVNVWPRWEIGWILGRFEPGDQGARGGQRGDEAPVGDERQRRVADLGKNRQLHCASLTPPTYLRSITSLVLALLNGLVERLRFWISGRRPGWFLLRNERTHGILISSCLIGCEHAVDRRHQCRGLGSRHFDPQAAAFIAAYGEIGSSSMSLRWAF